MTRARPGRNGRACAGGGRAVALALALALTAACTQWRAPAPTPLDDAARTYLLLVAQLTRQDARSASGDSASVPSSPPDHDTEPAPSFTDIAAGARAAAAALSAAPSTADQDRRDWLVAHLTAVGTRAAMKAGTRLSLRDELSGLFGIVQVPVPVPAGGTVDATRAELVRLLPGTGSPGARLDALDEEALIPAERLPVVFDRALEECRARTRRLLALPEAESVSVSYVRGEPWSAFSTYMGVGLSRIDVNLSFALTVDRALELACHEGYPGHHVINLLRDRRAKHGRPELGAIPLFSPESFASEAVATTAATLVFTDAERLAFERDVLFPLAGLRPDLAQRHHTVARLIDRLAPAIEEGVVRYLTGESDYVETLWALQAQALMHHPEATLGFVNEHRSFALAYTWAKGHQAMTPADGGRRNDAWNQFTALLAGNYRASLQNRGP